MHVKRSPDYVPSLDWLYTNSFYEIKKIPITALQRWDEDTEVLSSFTIRFGKKNLCPPKGTYVYEPNDSHYLPAGTSVGRIVLGICHGALGVLYLVSVELRDKSGSRVMNKTSEMEATEKLDVICAATESLVACKIETFRNFPVTIQFLICDLL